MSHTWHWSKAWNDPRRVFENKKMLFQYKVPERLSDDGIQVLLHAEEPRGQIALPAESLQVPPG